jgi:hypothetical protein
MKTKQLKFLTIKSIITIDFIISLIFICFFVNFLSYGFEFTDEAYYLLSISNPWEYDITATQFGFIYYPLYKIFQGNIIYIRIFSLFSILVINTILSYLFINFFNLVKNDLSNRWLLILSWILSTLSLCVYSLWLPSPNYNILNFQALSLILIGVILVSHCKVINLKHKNLSFFLGWIVIGLSGFLAFMSRPHTGAGLAALVLVWAWLSSNFDLKGLAIAIVVSFVLMFCTAIILDGSILSFIKRYANFYDITKLSGSHETSSIFNFNIQQFLHSMSWPFAAAFCGLSMVGGLVSYFSKSKFKHVYFTIIYIFLAIFLVSIILIVIYIPQINYIGHLLWAPALGALLVRHIKDTHEKLRITKSRLGWSGFILALAYLYGVGSNNEIIFTLSIASFFIFLALLLLLYSEQQLDILTNKIVGIITCSFFVVILVITCSWSIPYRQIDSIWNFSTEVEVPIGGTKLKMPVPIANFITNLYDSARNNSYETGTPIIDLTGRTPGAVFLLGGYFPKMPWLNYGYKGSEEAAKIALKRLTCNQLATAWIITDYTGNAVLDPSILLEAGVEFENDYTLRGAFEFPLGFKSIFLRPLVLLSPKLPDIRTESCQTRRLKK